MESTIVKTHRDRYPEQYTHPSVGKMAAFRSDPEVFHRILRVMPTQWGLLAKLEQMPDTTAFALHDLMVKE